MLCSLTGKAELTLHLQCHSECLASLPSALTASPDNVLCAGCSPGAGHQAGGQGLAGHSDLLPGRAQGVGRHTGVVAWIRSMSLTNDNLSSHRSPLPGCF